MRFYCNGCGSCCRRIGLVLPLFDRGDSTCVHLTEKGCAIYNERPLICRVDLYHATQDTGMPLEAWHKVNNDKCVEMQFEDGMKKGTPGGVPSFSG